jgi:hypothetical protein
MYGQMSDFSKLMQGWSGQSSDGEKLDQKGAFSRVWAKTPTYKPAVGA